MQWFQIISLVGTLVIIPLLGLIWKQGQNIQRSNIDSLRIHQKDIDNRLAHAVSESKEIKENYLTRFEKVNNNINGLRNEITDRLGRIETKISK